MSPHLNGQRPGPIARFGLKAMVAALLLAPALSLGLAEPVADIALAKKDNGGEVGTEDFSAPRYRSTITIHDKRSAEPYGSTVNVSGLNGTIVDINLILRNFTHDSPRDVSVMLAHQGRATVLVGQAGGDVALRSANIVLDDDHNSSALPQNGPIISNLAYRPHDFDPANDKFGGEAPDNGDDNPNANQRQYLNFFDGVTANGAWTLWVRDDIAPISGTLGGWQLEIVTSDDLPLIAVDTYRTKQRKKLKVPASEGVLRSDPLHGSDNLTAALVSGSGPRKGKLKFHENGSFTYKPKNNKKGRDSFQYVINDELGAKIDGKGEVRIKVKNDKKHKKPKKHKRNRKHKRRN